MLRDELRELIVLLDYGSSAGNISSKTISEVATAHDLKFIFEDVIKYYLVSSSSSTRINASVTLNKLCRKFSVELTQLLSTSASDGALLTMAELDLEHLFKQSDSIELLGGKSILLELNDNVHKKSWLRRCRKMLHERLGWESGNVDITAAMDFLDPDVETPLLDPRDLTGTALELSSDNDVSRDRNADAFDENEDESSESWIARLVRYMTVGLLDPCWESRHGCALGLVSVLSGVLVSFASADDSYAHSNLVKEERIGCTLPSFLVEDIVCHGLCTLLLDRFVDLGYSGSSSNSNTAAGVSSATVSTSPVKEAVGLLLARVSFLHSFHNSIQSSSTQGDTLSNQVFSRLTWIASRGWQDFQSSGSHDRSSAKVMLHRNWVVRQGGLIALKHFVSAHYDTPLVYPNACEQLGQLCISELLDQVDDVQNASAGLFLAIGRLCSVHSRIEGVNAKGELLSDLLWSLSGALMQSITSLDLLSVRTVSLFQAVTAYSNALLSECDRGIDIFQRLLTALHLQNALVSKLHLFASSTRTCCLLEVSTFLSNIHQVLEALSTSDQRPRNTSNSTQPWQSAIPAVMSVMMGLLRNLTSAAESDLGDLHLTSQWDQEKRAVAQQTSSNAPEPDLPVSNTDTPDNFDGPTNLSPGEPSTHQISSDPSISQFINKQTLSARLGSLIGNILVILSSSGDCNRNDLLYRVAIALVRDSCSVSAPDNQPIKSDVLVRAVNSHAVFQPTKTRKRKQASQVIDEELPAIDSGKSESTSAILSLIESFTAQINSIQINLFDLNAFRLSISNFSGAFPDKCLCQLAEFITGLLSSSPTGLAEFLAAVNQVRVDVLGAAIELDGNQQSAVKSNADKKSAPVIKMRLVQGDDMTKSVDSVGTGTRSKLSHRSRVLSILSWISVAAYQLVVSQANDSVPSIFQKIILDWEQEKAAKCARVVWHSGLLKALTAGSTDNTVNWIKRIMSALVTSCDEDTLRAVSDHFSFLILLRLFPPHRVTLNGSQGNCLTVDCLSILCSLLTVKSPGGSILFRVLFASIAQELGYSLLSSHLPMCVRPLIDSPIQTGCDVGGVNADTFSQALQFLSVTLPVLRTESAYAEMLLKSPLLCNILVLGEKFNTTPSRVASVLASSCQGESTTSKQLWSMLLHSIYLVISSTVLADGCKAYHSSILYELTRSVSESNLVTTYEHWLRVCLLGIGSYLPAVRQACTAAFRNIIPLSAVVVQSASVVEVTSPKDQNVVMAKGDSQYANGSDSVDVLAQVLSRTPVVSITSSASTQDAAILRALSTLGSSLLTPSTADPSNGGPALRSYQVDGATWLTHLRRCGLSGCLADEMGLGKSAQALTSLAIMRIEKALNWGSYMEADLMNGDRLQDIMAASAAIAPPCLIVCPASLVAHWEAETRKFLPRCILAPIRFTGKDMPLDGASIVIVSYDQLRAHINKFLYDSHASEFSSSRERVWAAVVIDEAHLVKNPASKTAQCVFQLKSQFRIAISGTPVQNNLEELWSVMNFLLPDFLGPHGAFMKTVARPVQKSMLERRKMLSLDAVRAREEERTEGKPPSQEKKQSVAAEGLDILRKLHKQVLPFILHRTKSVVAADIPAKTIIDVMCPLSDAQKQLYAEFLSDSRWTDAALETEFRALVGDATEDNPGLVTVSGSVPPARKIHPFQALHYLKLLCIHPSLVIGVDHGAYRQRLVNELASSTKMLHLADLLVQSGVVLRDEAGGPFDQLTDILQAKLVGEKVSNYVQEQAHHADDEDDDHDSNDDDESDDVSVSENKTSASEADSKLRAPKKSTAREVVLQSRKTQSKADARPKFKVEPPEKQLVSGSEFAHKCLIFSTHKAVLDIVETTVLKRYFSSVRYARLDGSVSPTMRGELVAEFNDRRSDMRILLLTKSCCGLGLNLVGADTVIFVEHDFNPFVDLQAMDRAHRIGQDRPVTVYRIIGMDTIEARIMSLQSFKRDIVSEIVSDRNAHSFSNAASTTSQVPPAGPSTTFEGALWSSVKGRAVGEESGGVGSTSTGANRYQSRSRTYEMWMQEEYEDADLSKFIKSITN